MHVNKYNQPEPQNDNPELKDVDMEQSMYVCVYVQTGQNVHRA